MHIDLRTVSIKPLRQTFDHVARRIGEGKAASRYQEGTLDLQATANFHYRPTWDPAHEIFDVSRTALRMADWYAFKDPRQFYYGTYTITRGRQQETAEANFDFVDTRGLADMLEPELRTAATRLLVPLRHVAWGANMNNAAICAYAYGTAITQPCIYHAMDQLGIAQYLTRAGLLLGDLDALDEGRRAWLEDEAWQGLRRYVEDSFVVQDPIELYVAQNVALDGLLYPLVYLTTVDDVFASRGGSAVALLTSFMSEWFQETRKWVDATLKTAAGESADNKALLEHWSTHWRDRAASALRPVARIGLGEAADEMLADALGQFNARLAKAGLTV
ncbi:phenol hydroxylase [Pseudothauera nasutitermitis]|uniref:Phenol hydroxylase n=1 Tax=Pseudothauera nasutitermitis TaxID=2565930 RepID=A0A4S4ATF9_9RHOO|nr:aromatic/alkene monooxygenase hydroxylase subunit beta [Pseudothauera nasutitermitis]THF61861.1 phenol hydroxylase [Pseudothauera nasutitermitis]